MMTIDLDGVDDDHLNGNNSGGHKKLVSRRCMEKNERERANKKENVAEKVSKERHVSDSLNWSRNDKQASQIIDIEC